MIHGQEIMGYISILEDGRGKVTRRLVILSLMLAGKFKADLDNSVNRRLHKMGYLGTTPLESPRFCIQSAGTYRV